MKNILQIMAIFTACAMLVLLGVAIGFTNLETEKYPSPPEVLEITGKERITKGEYEVFISVLSFVTQLQKEIRESGPLTGETVDGCLESSDTLACLRALHDKN